MSSQTVLKLAHKLREGWRTADVLNAEGADFASLLLSESVQQGLTLAGFERPSPIQLKAIPLGRCGLDLIVQAKSGTGKTCVFAVIALESLVLQTFGTQVLVLAPTREIAVQIHDVVVSIGQAMPGLKCHVFIGGLPVHEDKQKLKKCHIAIGSPGRIKQLIELGVLKTTSIRLFVLDEADKLLESGSFQEQINWIYSSLPDNKQMVALSATYPESLAHHLQVYMRDPTFVRLDIQDLSLKGIKQFYSVLPQLSPSYKSFQAKTDQLIKLLSRVPFHQCLVFSNDQGRAQNLSKDLNSQGWPTAYISGSQEQTQRLNAMSQLRNFQCRVLVSTDLTARGIDAEKVNLVVNLDVPQDWETYMHRIGRAGRFGTQGAAVTLVYSGKEESRLETITKHCHLSLQPLPNPIPSTLITSRLATSDEVLSSGDQVTVTRGFMIPKDHEEEVSLESASDSNVPVHETDPDTSVGRASFTSLSLDITNQAEDMNCLLGEESSCQSQQQGPENQSEQFLNGQSEQSLNDQSEETLNDQSGNLLSSQSEQRGSSQFYQNGGNSSNSRSDLGSSTASRSTQSMCLSDSVSHGSYFLDEGDAVHSVNTDSNSFDNSTHEVFSHQSDGSEQKETKATLENDMAREPRTAEVKIPSLASFKKHQKVRLTFQQASEDLDHFLTHGTEKYGAHNVQLLSVKQLGTETRKQSEGVLSSRDIRSGLALGHQRKRPVGSGRLQLLDELSNMSDHIEQILNSYGEGTGAKAHHGNLEQEATKVKDNPTEHFNYLPDTVVSLEAETQDSTEVENGSSKQTWLVWAKQGARPKGGEGSKEKGRNSLNIPKLLKEEKHRILSSKKNLHSHFSGEVDSTNQSKDKQQQKGRALQKSNNLYTEKFNDSKNHDVQRLVRTEVDSSEASTDGSWEQDEEETIENEGEWQGSDEEESDEDWEEEDGGSETDTEEDSSEEDYDSYDSNPENSYYKPDQVHTQYSDHIPPPPSYEEYPWYGTNWQNLNPNFSDHEFSRQYSSAPWWSVPERTAIGETWCCCGRRDCVRNRWLSTWARAYSSQCLYMAAMLGNRDYR